MGSKSYFIFAIAVTFAFNCTPTLTTAQWPITEQPSLGQQGINDKSEFSGNSNKTFPSVNANNTYSNSIP
jgi:hypothetical protein